MKQLHLIRFICLLSILSCNRSADVNTGDVTEGLTPVTVTQVTVGSLSDSVSLNATSAFLLKTSVKSDINGYLEEVNIHLGQQVEKGQELFTVRSKESERLGNTLSQLDSVLRFSGLESINSPASGFITELSYQTGDYVQDGEAIATISDMSSLVFLLELPYELNPFIIENKTVELILPDGKSYKGTVESSLPEVDPIAQTQSYLIRVPGISTIPENLVATVLFYRKSKQGAAILPKEAVLADETLSEYWIMKMTDQETAVKVPVTIGLETSDMVEIVSPPLEATDMILLTGNYGLPDTAKVIIENTY